MNLTVTTVFSSCHAASLKSPENGEKKFVAQVERDNSVTEIEDGSEDGYEDCG